MQNVFLAGSFLGAPGLVVAALVVDVPEDFVWASTCPDDAGPVFEIVFTVVLRLAMIALLACMRGAVLSEGGGSTAVQPTKEGVEVHCASVGKTALQPADVGVAAHCARDGRTVAHPAREGMEVH